MNNCSATKFEFVIPLTVEQWCEVFLTGLCITRSQNRKGKTTITSIGRLRARLSGMNNISESLYCRNKEKAKDDDKP
jgi:hypothetical protein